jgi:tetratricopeptide (TPR) repeat protein
MKRVVTCTLDCVREILPNLAASGLWDSLKPHAGNLLSAAGLTLGGMGLMPAALGLGAVAAYVGLRRVCSKKSDDDEASDLKAALMILRRRSTKAERELEGLGFQLKMNFANVHLRLTSLDQAVADVVSAMKGDLSNLDARIEAQFSQSRHHLDSVWFNLWADHEKVREALSEIQTAVDEHGHAIRKAASKIDATTTNTAADVAEANKKLDRALTILEGYESILKPPGATIEPCPLSDADQATLDAAKSSADALTRFRIAVAKGDFAEAKLLESEVEWLLAAQRTEQDFVYSRAKGDLAYRMGEYMVSVSHYERAHELNPEDAATTWNLSAALIGSVQLPEGPFLYGPGWIEPDSDDDEAAEQQVAPESQERMERAKTLLYELLFERPRCCDVGDLTAAADLASKVICMSREIADAVRSARTARTEAQKFWPHERRGWQYKDHLDKKAERCVRRIEGLDWVENVYWKLLVTFGDAADVFDALRWIWFDDDTLESVIRIVDDSEKIGPGWIEGLRESWNEVMEIQDAFIHEMTSKQAIAGLFVSSGCWDVLRDDIRAGLEEDESSHSADTPLYQKLFESVASELQVEVVRTGFAAWNLPHQARLRLVNLGLLGEESVLDALVQANQAIIEDVRTILQGDPKASSLIFGLAKHLETDAARAAHVESLYRAIREAAPTGRVSRGIG